MRIYIYLSILTIFCSSCAGKQKTDETSSSQALTTIQPVAPENNDEETILKKIADAAVGKSIQSGSGTFVVTNSYFAASGRECKSIEIVTADNRTVFKTVCDYDGTWGFAPDVLPNTTNQ
ncbi:MAG: hypothetical protein JXX29_22460 [Deltaproteobacteria bacterium]|nr:hypothetical protein [Deltaproteobacteria bacterium]MBN2674460.1 hypothetical protein [Deltaproteobacteria bacterium]